jgi:hypothetical protein
VDILKHISDQIDTRLPKGDMSGIKLRDCRWSVKTAGPSPYNNERTELFLLGCKKAMSGNPCQGCFNSTTWDASTAEWTHDPIKMAEHIKRNAPNRYITIGGGEPTDQIDNLIILCKELKKYRFHIMIYTWRELKHITVSNKEDIKKLDPYSFMFKVHELLKYVDIVVDGEYKQEERLWDGTKEDGLISSVGSGNQIVWNIPYNYGYHMRDIDSLILHDDNFLLYALKNYDTRIKLY